VDNNQVSKGQCTYLHWQTSNADRVDIDGNTVQNSGDQQVCPTVTKKYTLTATNQSGTANRNLTVIVSDQSSTINVADYFQTGNIIQIGSDIYAIVNGERRLVPNPETLDALGITRSWIDNKGFGDTDLKTIPLGQDIPDVNLDPSGFAAFKNRYFSNTTPIIPGTEPTAPPVPNQPQEPNSSSNGQWQVGARVGLCAGAQIRSGSGFSYPTHTIVPENNWQVEIIDGPRNSDGVIWWSISRKNIDGGGTGWVYFEQAGLCNKRNDEIPTPFSENNPAPPNGTSPDNNNPENNPSSQIQVQPTDEDNDNQLDFKELVDITNNGCDGNFPIFNNPYSDIVCGGASIAKSFEEANQFSETRNFLYLIHSNLSVCSGTLGVASGLLETVWLLTPFSGLAPVAEAGNLACQAVKQIIPIN
jgi:hypothetical protein